MKVSVCLVAVLLRHQGSDLHLGDTEDTDSGSCRVYVEDSSREVMRVFGLEDQELEKR